MADKKITALTVGVPIATDVIPYVSDPGGSPVTKKTLVSSLGGGGFNQGFMTNGKIVPSVTSNNLTVALKTLAGTDPTATDKIQIRIGDTVRDITAALSVTKNAGTGWFALDTRFATLEQDFFVYIGYNATDGITLGFARIPWASLYSDFSATSTNEKYCAISTITNAAAGDNYVNIGRFAATLSATASFNWSVPTFTNANLIQRPIYNTRWLTWAPAYTGITSPSTAYAKFQLHGFKKCTIEHRYGGTISGTPAALTATVPFEIGNSANSPCIGSILWSDNTSSASFGGIYGSAATPDLIASIKYNGANWGTTPVSNGYGEYETE